MTFRFEQVPVTESAIVLGFLYETAVELKNKEVDQWRFWLQPSADELRWIEDGVRKREFYYVTEQSGEIAGMFRLQTSDELYWGKQEIEARYIHSLVVRKAYAGQQLGHRIMTQIESEMKAAGIPTLRLDCNAENNWLCSYYEQLGFLKVGEKQMPRSRNNLYEKLL